MPKAVSRLRLVAPVSSTTSSTTLSALPLATDLVIRGLTDSLMTQGVTVTQQLVMSGKTAPSDGLRCDLALWLPDENGATVACDPRVITARAHAALVVDASANPRDLSRYDALFVFTDGHKASLDSSIVRGGRAVPVHTTKLSAMAHHKDAEKAARTLSGLTIAVDLRPHSVTGAELERTIMQLALRTASGTLLLPVGDDDEHKKRARTLCDRHNVGAYLVGGKDGMAQAIRAADVVVGALRWDELLLAASCTTSVTTVDVARGKSSALGKALAADTVVLELESTLRLSVSIDRAIATVGFAGVKLHDALIQPPRLLHATLCDVEALPGAALAEWEPVGPLAYASLPPIKTLDETAAEVSTAQRVEDALAALKQRLADQSGKT